MNNDSQHSNQERHQQQRYEQIQQPLLSQPYNRGQQSSQYDEIDSKESSSSPDQNSPTLDHVIRQDQIDPPTYYSSVVDSSGQYRPNRFAAQQSQQQRDTYPPQQEMYQQQQAVSYPPQRQVVYLHSPRPQAIPIQVSSRRGFYPDQIDDMQYMQQQQGGLRSRRRLGGGVHRRNQPRRQGLISMAMGAARNL
jgi:hypothetical protein